MGIFAAYHYIRAEDDEPAASRPAEAALPAAEVLPARALIPAPAVPAPSAPSAPAEDERLIVPRLLTTLAQQNQQLQAERLTIRQVRGALLALANQLCQAALERERRQKGDADLAKWPPQAICQFIEVHTRDLVAALREGADGGLAEAYHRLNENHQGLLQQAASLREVNTRLRQELAELREARAGQPSENNEPEADEASASARPAAPANTARLHELVRLMATTGLARFSRIREALTAEWGLDARSGSVRAVVDMARTQGLLKVYEVKNDWQGAHRALFLELTPAGLELAQSLGLTPAANEMQAGLRRGYPLAQIHLILRAADLLAAEGCPRTRLFPEAVPLADGQTYTPMLAAVDGNGQLLLIECERESAAADRTERWLRAAQAGHGELHLVTTTAAQQESLVSEINLAKLRQPFRLKATNIVDCTRRVRAADGSIWLYQG